MTIPDNTTVAKRMAQLIAGLNILLVLSTFVLSFIAQGQPSLEIVSLSAIVYSVIAVLIISRQPGHTVGWLFLIVGFFSALGSMGTLGLESKISSELFQSFGTWAGYLSWIPALMIPITLVLQFFPDGRLPSRRWWPITVASLIGMVGFAVSIAFHPWPWETQEIFEPHNPFGLPGSERFFELVLDIAGIALTIGLIGSLAAVVVRFVRSRGAQRLQIKWLVYTAVVSISSLLLIDLVLGAGSRISELIFVSIPSLLAIATGSAILRYRLFDIDIIIRRTLQYGILTGVLAVIYFGLVVSLQAMFSTVGNQQSAIFIVISTLVIAGLFNPLRIRIQKAIDRRFYRQKYQAEQVLAEFATTARDEVDLEVLTAALLAVVEETMQPSSVSLVLISEDD